MGLIPGRDKCEPSAMATSVKFLSLNVRFRSHTQDGYIIPRLISQFGGTAHYGSFFHFMFCLHSYRFPVCLMCRMFAVADHVFSASDWLIADNVLLCSSPNVDCFAYLPLVIASLTMVIYHTTWQYLCFWCCKWHVGPVSDFRIYTW